MASVRGFSFVNQGNIKLKELKSKRESFRTRLFLMMLEIAFIFAVPALIAVLLGRKLESMSGSNAKFTIIFLIITFVFSWIVVVIRFRKANKALKEINAEIKNTENQK